MPDYALAIRKAQRRAAKTLGIKPREISNEEWAELLKKGTALEVLERELKRTRELLDAD